MNACSSSRQRLTAPPVAAILATACILLSVPHVARGQRPRLNLLENPGFEDLSDGKPTHWRITDTFSTISEEQAHSGSRSLKIADDDPNKGSSVYGSLYSVIPKREYFVRGWAYLAQGEGGLGVYLQFLDAGGKAIKDADGQQQVCRPGLQPGRWTQFFQPMTVPDGAVKLRLWIHTFNASKTVVYLDDLELLECFENVFGDTVKWQGGSPDHTITNHEDYSVRWAHAESASLTRTFGEKHPLDWSDRTGVSFWLHANQPTGHAFMFIIVSENPITLGMDYWSAKINVDWTGWKQFVFAFTKMGKARKPLGLDKINKVYFTATGWGNTPDPDVVIHLEGMRPVNVSQ